MQSKRVTVRGQDFTLQSVSPMWYKEQSDKHGITGSGRRDTPGYMDVMFRNCIIKPTEVANKGMKYFDESEDVKTAIYLLKAIETFLASENDIGEALRRARRNKEFWCFVFAGNGLTYTELKAMDLAEYREAIEARSLWQDEWCPKPNIKGR